MNRTVARMLGEAADVADQQEVTPASTPEEPAQINYASPSVDQLVALWQAGQHEAVALRVLDALDKYADFLELAFQIGHDEALQLGQIMDTMTSEEKSPHEYDDLADQDVAGKFGRSPDVTAAHGAVGE